MVVAKMRFFLAAVEEVIAHPRTSLDGEHYGMATGTICAAMTGVLGQAHHLGPCSNNDGDHPCRNGGPDAWLSFVAS